MKIALILIDCWSKSDINPFMKGELLHYRIEKHCKKSSKILHSIEACVDKLSGDEKEKSSSVWFWILIIVLILIAVGWSKKKKK